LESLELTDVGSHISRKTSEMARISRTWHRTGLRARLSLKERRIEFAERINLDGKSGMWGTRDLFREAEKGPQISPLRCAPVEMTVLLGTGFYFSMKGPRNCGSLGFARDDKGEGGSSLESGYRTEGFFITFGRAAGP
jgi:hypothetical protein